MPKREANRVVWSSTDGDLRKARDPQLKARIAAGGRVKVRRETSGRRGKAVTTVAGVPLDDAGLKELAGRLKKRCGVGGAVEGGGGREGGRDRAAGRPPRRRARGPEGRRLRRRPRGRLSQRTPTRSTTKTS